MFYALYDFLVKVKYYFAVILKKGDESLPLFEYSYANKYFDVELDAAFKISTEADILKFEEMFKQSRGVHLPTLRKNCKILLLSLMLNFMSLNFCQCDDSFYIFVYYMRLYLSTTGLLLLFFFTVLF